MTLSRSTIGALACAALLVGCGGSGTSSSSSTAAPTTAGSTATASASASSSAGTTTSAATTTSSAGQPPEAAGTHHKSKPQPSVSSGATIPAAFLLQNGKLSPPAVAVPAGVTIALGVNNRDHARYTVVLVAQGRHTMHLGPVTGAVLSVSALPKGSYPVLVDGSRQATLTVGATGGP